MARVVGAKPAHARAGAATPNLFIGGKIRLTVGKDHPFNSVVVGGNQSDAVTIARYRKAALIGARWPDTVSNSRTIQSLLGSGLAETAERGAGQAAEHVELNSDQIAEALGTAQQQVTELASHLRIAQYLLVAIAVAGLCYAIYRFVWRHLKPLPVPEVLEEGPSIDDVPVEVTPAPVCDAQQEAEVTMIGFQPVPRSVAEAADRRRRRRHRRDRRGLRPLAPQGFQQRLERGHRRHRRAGQESNRCGSFGSRQLARLH